MVDSRPPTAVLGSAVVYLGMPPVIDRVGPLTGPRNVWLIVGALTCLALPVMLVLDLMRTFANRACMLEDSGVLAAYGRGFKLLGENLASALLLFVIQVGIGIALGLALLLPALCCLVWPLLILVQGTSAAYFSTMWTVAWRQWTGAAPVPGEAPAV